MLAASYAFGIAKNHPFADGNKRTAFVVYRTFLRLAQGELGEEELSEWVRGHLRRI